MAKFCGKCGSKLDEATGFCPKCDAAQIKRHYDKIKETETPVQEKGIGPISKNQNIDKRAKKKALKAQKKAAKKEKRAKWSTGKKVRRFFLKLLLTVLLLSILVTAIAGALVYFEVVEIPVVSYILERSGLDKKEIVNIDPLVDNYVPEETTIVFDEETNLFYANNEIIVIFLNDTTDTQKKDVISYLNGELVGTIPELNMYQIIIPKCDTLEELIHIADEVMLKFDYIIYATYDTASINPDDAYVPNDPWNGDVTKEDWEDSSVDGSNWWIEAIDAQNAWNYRDNFSEITIGICDSSFDTGHEDLKNRVSFPNEILESRNVVTPWWNDFQKETWSVSDQENYHGTHVAGIIGAEGDNKKGITGIVQNCKLLLAPYYRSENMDAYLAWDSSTYANLSYLVEAGAKVINFSQGKTNFLSERTNHVAYDEKIIEREGHLASISIAQLIDSGYRNFIVVQSAGNGTGDTGKALDAIQNGWFASITDNSITGYDDITIDEVRSHVIIVGAAEQTSSGFQYASFSNYGTQVDICAPGVNIYSTVPGEVFYDFQFFGGYDYASGTSMSAPIVTGVCALTWSANPELSAEEVKNIVCNNSPIKVSAKYESQSSLSYNMVNANLSVEAAINYASDKKKAEINGEFNQSDVPVDAVEFNGHYYYLYDLDTATTWEEAKEYCESQGGYLATITSQEEDEFLYSYITDMGYDSVLFGLSDTHQDNVWTWVTGEPFSYENWASGEPSHQGGYEHYGMYYEKYKDGSWNDGSGKTCPFLCEWGEYNAATTPPSENYYETDTAFGKYLAAAAKTTGAGSWSERLSLEADMSIAYDGGKTKTKVTLTADSDVSNYVEDDLSQIKITSLANMKVMGQTYAWSTEYYDGVAHYEYTEPFQRSESLEIPPDFFDFEASIPEEAILTEEISGNQIRFIISGEGMTETGIAAVQQMSGVNSLECEDVEVIATLNDSGSIDQIEMNFNASVEYQGYDADVTYRIQYTFS